MLVGSRLGPAIAHTDLGNTRYGYLALAGLCLTAMLLTEAFTLVVMTRALCPRASVWGVFGIAFESLLVGGATSFGGLEIPYQVVRLRQAAVPASQATSAIVGKALIHTSLLVLVAAGALVPAIGAHLSSLQRWIVVAGIIGVLVAWAAIALWTGTPLGEGLLPRRLRRYLASFREANLALARAGWRPTAVTIALQSIYWVAAFSLIPLILTALGYDGGFFHVVFAQAVLQVVMPFSPLPGGAGVAELGYLGLIGASVPSGLRVSSLLLWRLFTWLVPMALGVLAICVRVVISGKRAVTRPAAIRSLGGTSCRN